MDSLVIITLGIATVIIGVMLLRLHAFLALIAGAFVIAVLTPGNMIETSFLKDKWIKCVKSDGLPQFYKSNGTPTYVHDGDYYLKSTKEKFKPVVVSSFNRIPQGSFSNGVPRVDREDIHRGYVIISYEEGWDNNDGFENVYTPDTFEILPAEDLRLGIKLRDTSPIDRIATGLGKTFTQIGIMIAMAAILGQCMLLNGSALKIVTTIRETLGERYTTVSFVVCSFILAIPVYFDTVFYLMLPLAKAMAQQTKKDYLKYVISIVVGGTLAHSLVPPTPGPLLVAEKLSVNIATMFVMGSVVSIMGIIVGYVYMNFINRFVVLPIPESEESNTNPDIVQRPIMPPFWLAILPILFPVFTIGLQASWEVLLNQYGEHVPSTIFGFEYISHLTKQLEFWGDKNISLACAAILGMFTTYLYSALSKKEYLNKMQEALADGGLIILITCAGGALGEVIRQTDIVHRLSAMSPTSGSGMMLLWMAFLVTGVIRIAQGSATVSMLTSVGIFAPLASSGTLPYHPVYLALAIGCGSKLMPWMNDSGFWLVGRMSGMSEAQTFKSFSILLTIMGFAGFFATLTLASFFPLK